MGLKELIDKEVKDLDLSSKEKEIIRRMKYVLDNPPKQPTNCRGTGLYVAGLTEIDSKLSVKKTKEYLKDKKESYQAKNIGDLLIFNYCADSDYPGGWSYSIEHLAVVLRPGPNPLLFHRNGTNGSIKIERLQDFAPLCFYKTFYVNIVNEAGQDFN